MNTMIGWLGVSSRSSLAGAVLAFCLAVRGQAFVGHRPPLPSLSAGERVVATPPFLQHHHRQQQSIVHPSRTRPRCYSSSSSSSGSSSGRRTRCPAAASATMLTSSPRPRPTTRRSSSGSSSRTALSAEGGGGEPMGPGTQQLSRQAKLAISILIDLIGMSSYALPGVGEAADLGWAPISSALIFYLYGNSIFAGLAFVEEILPGFDIIPTATIAWFLTNSEVGKNVTNAATGKAKTGGGGASSSVPPPPPAASSPFSKTKFGQGGGSRKVDDEQVQSGVIDVEPEN